MTNMRMIFALAFIAIISLTAISQDVKETETKKQIQDQTYSYTYISIKGKAFSKKLKVEVDFGDTPEQINESKSI